MKYLTAIFWISFIALGVAIMVALGFWQLSRLEERRAHNAQVESQIHQPPVEITGEPFDPTGLEYKPITVTGTYDYSHEIVLRNRTFNNAPGVHVLTPLKINGSDKAILIDRGWIPYEYSLFSQRKPYQNITGTVTITGLLRLSQAKTAPIGPSDPFVNADMPRLDAWFWVNIPQIQQQFRTYELMPFFIEQDPGPDETVLPAPSHDIDLSEGSHLSYAIQWFSFAVILVVGSAALWWSRRNGGQKVELRP